MAETAGMTVSFPSSAKGEAPRIQIQPRTLTVPSEQNLVQFWVTAVDGNQVTYQWLADAVPIVDDATYSGTDNPILSITMDGTTTLSGTEYSCVIANNVGSVTTAVALLTVT